MATETSMEALRGMNAALMPTTDSAVSTNLEEARAIAQIQGGMIMAKRFRRDEQTALTKILKTCNVVEFADEAEYAFPRGGQTVRGPTIRLLEEIMRQWGNIEWNVMELTRADGESLASTYCVDLENNTWARRQFVVPHTRDKNEDGKRGEVQQVELRSDRDIYEKIANMGSRRVRACMEQLIPKYVIDAAVDRCRLTRSERDKRTPLMDRIPKLIDSFAKSGVSQPMLTKWLKGRPLREMLENEYQDLYAIWRSIKDGYARIDEHFEQPSAADAVAGRKAAAGNSQPSGQPQGAQQRPAADGKKPADSPPPAKAAETNERPAEVVGGIQGTGGRPVDEGRAVDTAAAAGAGNADAPEPQGQRRTRDDFLKIVAAAQGTEPLSALSGELSAALAAGDLTKEDVKAVRIATANRVKELQKAARDAASPQPQQQPLEPQQQALE
jgi:hypothetical protein